MVNVAAGASKACDVVHIPLKFFDSDLSMAGYERHDAIDLGDAS
jgi:hypothetical protein